MNITFSNVEQCGQVNISFSGQDLAQVIQARLTVLPLESSQPIPISVSTPLTDTTVSFLPLPAGSQFIALLDDPWGNGTSVTSNITTVSPSTTNATSCLPPVTEMFSHFLVEGLDQLTQCQTFSVLYNGTQEPPIVQLVVAQGSSFPLQQVSSGPEENRATYMLNGAYGQEAVLLITDNSGHSEVTKLFTIGGDNSTDAQCMTVGPTTEGYINPNEMVGNTNMTDSLPAASGLSREAIIGIIAGAAGLIVLVVVLMLIYVIRDRRRRRSRQETMYLEAPLANWNSEKLPPTPPTATFDPGYVVNPPYVSEKYTASITSPRSTLSSWVNVSTISSKSGSIAGSYSSSNQATIGSKSRIMSIDSGSAGRSSISTVDLRQILDIAVMKDYAHSRSMSTSSVLPPARGSQLSFGRRASSILPSSPTTSTSMLSVPQQTMMPRLNLGHRRARGFPDVPVDPTASLTLSALFPIPPADIPTPPVSPTAPQQAFSVTPLTLPEKPSNNGYGGDSGEPSSPAPFTATTGVPTDCSADGSAGPMPEARPPRNLPSQPGGNRDTAYSTNSIWYGMAQ
ncbi:hypothetical protein ONZ45_g2396 [Pleurotus djamor]|nr:hypothetical protein ONZ45_g2396 [Pleurotus djamor]